MSQKAETRLASRIIIAMKRHGGWWVKIHGGPMQVSGIPDIIGCYRGRFVAVEVKMPGSQLRPRQILIMQRIVSAGGVAIVAENVTTAMGMLRSLDSLTDDSEPDT